MEKNVYYQAKKGSNKTITYTFNVDKKIITCNIQHNAKSISKKINKLFQSHYIQVINAKLTINDLYITPSIEYNYTGMGKVNVEVWNDEEIEKGKKEAYRLATLDIHNEISQDITDLANSFSGLLKCFKDTQSSYIKKINAKKVTKETTKEVVKQLTTENNG